MAAQLRISAPAAAVFLTAGFICFLVATPARFWSAYWDAVHNDYRVGPWVTPVGNPSRNITGTFTALRTVGVLAAAATLAAAVAALSAWLYVFQRKRLSPRTIYWPIIAGWASTVLGIVAVCTYAWLNSSSANVGLGWGFADLAWAFYLAVFATACTGAGSTAIVVEWRTPRSQREDAEAVAHPVDGRRISGGYDRFARPRLSSDFDHLGRPSLHGLEVDVRNATAAEARTALVAAAAAKGLPLPAGLNSDGTISVSTAGTGRTASEGSGVLLLEMPPMGLDSPPQEGHAQDPSHVAVATDNTNSSAPGVGGSGSPPAAEPAAVPTATGNPSA